VGSSGDCLLALSTSGNSENVVRACRVGKEKGLRVFSLTGEGGGRLASESELTIMVPDSNTARIQEMHLLVIHLICQLVETALFASDDGTAENRAT
jgi:D-sedoheptulose 7-phosphate isomerase